MLTHQETVERIEIVLSEIEAIERETYYYAYEIDVAIRSLLKVVE